MLVLQELFGVCYIIYIMLNNKAYHTKEIVKSFPPSMGYKKPRFIRFIARLARENGVKYTYWFDNAILIHHQPKGNVLIMAHPIGAVIHEDHKRYLKVVTNYLEMSNGRPQLQHEIYGDHYLEWFTKLKKKRILNPDQF